MSPIWSNEALNIWWMVVRWSSSWLFLVVESLFYLTIFDGTLFWQPNASRPTDLWKEVASVSFFNIVLFDLFHHFYLLSKKIELRSRLLLWSLVIIEGTVYIERDWHIPEFLCSNQDYIHYWYRAKIIVPFGHCLFHTQ